MQKIYICIINWKWVDEKNNFAIIYLHIKLSNILFKKDFSYLDLFIISSHQSKILNIDFRAIETARLLCILNESRFQFVTACNVATEVRRDTGFFDLSVSCLLCKKRFIECLFLIKTCFIHIINIFYIIDLEISTKL